MSETVRSGRWRDIIYIGSDVVSHTVSDFIRTKLYVIAVLNWHQRLGVRNALQDRRVVECFCA